MLSSYYFVLFCSAELTAIDINFYFVVFSGVAFTICATLSAFDEIIIETVVGRETVNGNVKQITLSFNSLICIWPFSEARMPCEGQMLGHFTEYH